MNLHGVVHPCCLGITAVKRICCSVGACEMFLLIIMWLWSQQKVILVWNQLPVIVTYIIIRSAAILTRFWQLIFYIHILYQPVLLINKYICLACFVYTPLFCECCYHIAFLREFCYLCVNQMSIIVVIITTVVPNKIDYVMLTVCLPIRVFFYIFVAQKVVARSQGWSAIWIIIWILDAEDHYFLWIWTVDGIFLRIPFKVRRHSVGASH